MVTMFFSQGAGECMAENIKIFERLFFRQREESFFQFGLLFFFVIHVTPADPGDGAVFRSKLTPDLQYFLFIHSLHFLSVLCCSAPCGCESRVTYLKPDYKSFCMGAVAGAPGKQPPSFRETGPARISRETERDRSVLMPMVHLMRVAAS